MTPSEVQALLERPMITPEELYLSRLLRCSRNTVYEAIHTKAIASLRIGKKILVPTGPLKRQLGLDEGTKPSPAAA